MPNPLPLFPLPLVTFPGALLPLHIFEPRYRRLLSDCLAGDHRFGIVTARSGAEIPAPGAPGTLVRIEAHHALPDGRSNIVTLGESRFTLVRWTETGTPYATGEVAPLEDNPETAPLPDMLERLRVLGAAYWSAFHTLRDEPAPGLEWSGDPERDSFLAAALLSLPLDQKERMLAGRSTRERCTQLLELLSDAGREAAERAAIHLRARTNGRGRHAPDLATGP